NVALVQLTGHGLATCDSFGGMRKLLHPRAVHRNRRSAMVRAGRWSVLQGADAEPAALSSELVELVAWQLLARYGVVFRTLIEPEKRPVPGRELARTYRLAELRGDVRGGRFVQRFSGEQYALPEAVDLMRRLRRSGQLEPRTNDGADPDAAVRSIIRSDLAG